jgi:hypothetical protein
MQPKVSKEILAQAVLIAQNIMKQSNIKRIPRNDIDAINDFLRRAHHGSTRIMLTTRDCEKIINIAKAYT